MFPYMYMFIIVHVCKIFGWKFIQECITAWKKFITLKSSDKINNCVLMVEKGRKYEQESLKLL